MAEGKKKSRWKLFLLIGAPVLEGLYQIAGPYLQTTSKMKTEAAKIDTEIVSIRTDSDLHTKKWLTDMEAKEKAASLALPDEIALHDVLAYFVTSFESAHPGIRFASVLPQTPTNTTIVTEPKAPPIKLRAEILTIRAKIPPDLLFPYLEHIEAYPGLYHVGNISLANVEEDKKAGGGSLTMDLALYLYLTPKELLATATKGKGNGEESREPSADIPNKDNKENWFEVNTLNPSPPPAAASLVPEKEALTPAKPEPLKKTVMLYKKPTFRVKQIMGGSVVVGDDLFEVGDSIQGWKVEKIDAKRGTVLLKRQNSSFEVQVK